MKRTLLTFAMTIATFLGFQTQVNAQTTKTYTDDLVVSINGESTEPQATTVIVEFLESGNINFKLKNFNLMGEINVGTIEINDLKVSHGRRYDSFLFKGDINILPGDIEGVSEDAYIGPIISPIPMRLKGKVSDDKLYVAIDIDMTETSLEQFIYVTFGTDFPALQVTSTKQYTDNLVVTINEESTEPQQTTVTVETLETGDINFVLKNFNLMGEINVGNIIVEEILVSEGAGPKTFSFNGNLDITQGDVEGVPEEAYLGPMISPIPLKLEGKITDDKLYVTIDIDMVDMLGQVIYVAFGSPFPNTFNVNFIVDGETVQSSALEAGATISTPTMEEREGYTFEWIDAIPATVTGDITIHGQYTINQYKVTFVVDGETLSSQSLDYNSTITAPEVEAREGYSFEWIDEIPTNVPAKDITINGQYVPNKYWVQIIVDGVAVYEVEQEYGTPIPVPEVEEREGYTFAWDSEIPATVPAEPVLVHGTYTANVYKITFMLDGQEYASYDLEYGATITAPEVTGDERYTFSGWDEVPETMPAHDVVVSGGMVDGVVEVQSSKFKVQRAYDLSGRLINIKHAQRKGIIIVNGKKVLVK